MARWTPPASWWPFRRSMHRNVKLILVAEFFLSMSGSIAFGTFLSAFLLQKTQRCARSGDDDPPVRSARVVI